MSNVIQFRRPAASIEVVEKLVELGYLKGNNWRRAGAVEGALARLKNDLCRDQTICASDPLPERMSYDAPKGRGCRS
jgi:hypothetical protein